jgi:type IVB pilus formation R64 PilN family outer membrane protein
MSPFTRVLFGSAALLPLASALFGCTAIETKRSTEVAMRDVEALTREPSTPSPPVVARHQRYSAEPHLGGYVYRSRNGVPLPPDPRIQAVQVSLPEGTTVRRIAAKLYQETGIPVFVVDETLSSAAAKEAPIVLPSDQRGDDMPANPLLLAQMLGAPVLSEPTMGINTMGNQARPLNDILDTIASTANLNWSYDGHSIKLFRYVYGKWKIAAFASITDLDQTVSTANPQTSSTGGGGEGGKASAKTSQKSDPWTTIVAGIRNLLPTGDYQLSETPITGQISVRAPADAIERVDDYIKTVNSELDRALDLNVEVITIDSAVSDDIGLALDGVMQSVGIGFATAAPSAISSAAAGTFAARVIDPPASSTWNRFRGSQIVAQALAKAGRVVHLYRMPGQTKNNQIKILRATEFLDYVQTITLPTATTGTTGLIVGPTVQQARAYGGTSLRTQPRIRDDGIIEIEGLLTIADLPTLTTFTPSAGQQIQQARGSTFEIPMTIRVPSGKTLVVAGFDQDIQSSTRAGIGDPDMILAGGQLAGQITRRRLIVMVTATELDTRLRTAPPAAGSVPPVAPGAAIAPPRGMPAHQRATSDAVAQ